MFESLFAQGIILIPVCTSFLKNFFKKKKCRPVLELSFLQRVIHWSEEPSLETHHEFQLLLIVPQITIVVLRYFSPCAITLHSSPKFRPARASDSRCTQIPDNHRFFAVCWGHSNLILLCNLEFVRSYPLLALHHEDKDQQGDNWNPGLDVAELVLQGNAV